MFKQEKGKLKTLYRIHATVQLHLLMEKNQVLVAESVYCFFFIIPCNQNMYRTVFDVLWPGLVLCFHL